MRDNKMTTSLNEDMAAIAAAQNGLAICDRSHWTVLRLTGDDRQNFLHNQTTNQIKLLQPGQGCDAVLVNSTGRTIDLATVCVGADDLTLVASPGQGATLMAWLDRYLFPMDRVELENLTGEVALFSLLGRVEIPELAELSTAPVGQHRAVELAGVPVIAIAGSGLSLPGITLKISTEHAATIWAYLMQQGAIPMSETAWEHLRILDGRPMPGAELTDKYNALEAGLWSAVSFTKGCYIGQETIARLNTHKGVKQRLWGLEFPQIVTAGATITVAGQKMGKVTSVSPLSTDEQTFALGYLKTRAGGADCQIQVEQATGYTRAISFVRHAYYDPKS